MTKSMEATVSSDRSSAPDVTCKEWEKGVFHPANFQTATRRARPHDVRPASKWAGISYYECNPKEIRKHLDVMYEMDQAHVQGVITDRENEQLRLGTWGSQQRDIFRRQRLEQANKYQSAGLPVRLAYDPEALEEMSVEHQSTCKPPSMLSRPQSAPPTSFLQRRSSSATPTMRVAGVNGSVVASTVRPDSGVSYHTSGTWGLVAAHKEAMAGQRQRPQSSVPRLSLPKTTPLRVQDRMKLERELSARRAVDRIKEEQEELKAVKAAEEVQQLMRELDDFELHIKSVKPRVEGSSHDLS